MVSTTPQAQSLHAMDWRDDIDAVSTDAAPSCDGTTIRDSLSTTRTSITVITGHSSSETLCAGTDILPEKSSSSVDGMTPKRSRLRLAAILAALFFSLFNAALDETIIATAIPTIASSLHSSSGYTWVGSAYLLAQACAGPVWAKLSDIFGRRPVLLTAVALFFCSSLLCALAPTMTILLVGRSLQGTAGGGLVLLVHVLISDLFSARVRSLLFGMLEIVWALAGGLGPLLGGVFAQLLSWRYCFWLNLPLTGITFALLFAFLYVHDPKTKFFDGIMAVDWLGTILILGATLMVLIGLEFGGTTFAWDSPVVICLLGFGLSLIVPFVLVERRVKYPLMPLHLLRSVSNVATLLICFFQGMVMIAALFYIPLYLQSSLMMTPLQSGLAILPLTLVSAGASALTGLLVHRFGRYTPPLYVGACFLVVGAALYTQLTVDTTYTYIVIFQCISGIGAGALFAPPLLALQAGVPHQSDVASVTGMFGFVRNLSAATSIVLGGSVFENRITALASSTDFGPSIAANLASNGISLTTTAAAVNASSAASTAVALLRHALTSGEAASSVHLIAQLDDASPMQQRVRDLYAAGLASMWIVYACLAGVVLLACFFVRGRVLAREHVETRTGLGELVRKGGDGDGDVDGDDDDEKRSQGAGADELAKPTRQGQVDEKASAMTTNTRADPMRRCAADSPV